MQDRSYYHEGIYLGYKQINTDTRKRQKKLPPGYLAKKYQHRAPFTNQVKMVPLLAIVAIWNFN